MTELLRQQISAFMDDELPAAEGEVLLRRLETDDELCRTYACYHLIGASLRREPDASGLAERVRAALHGEQPAAAPAAPEQDAPAWRGVLKPVAAVAVVAFVAVGAIALVQGVQRGADTPPVQVANASFNQPEPEIYATPTVSPRPSVYIGNTDLLRKALRHSSYAVGPNPGIMNYRGVVGGAARARLPAATAAEPVTDDADAGARDDADAEAPVNR